MPDFNPSSSLYPQAPAQPQAVNALTQAGNFVNIRNALQQGQILQQQVQQEQIQTQQAQDIQGAMGELQNYRTPNGGFDYNGWMSQSVAPKYPLAAQTALNIRNQNIGNIVTGTTDAQGNPVARTPESIATSSGGNSTQSTGNATQSTDGQQPANSSPGVFSAGLPADPLKQRDYMQNLQSTADAASKDTGALKNMYDNVVAHPENQGTMLGALKTLLAQRNIDVGDSADAATTLQLIKDHAKQLLVNSDNRSDQELLSKELASANPNDLGPTLKRMIPFLIGNRNMALDQSNYLQKQAPNGVNPAAIGSARTFLQPRSDTRVYELRWLQQNDPVAFNARLKSLSPEDRTSLGQMSAELTAKQELPHQ